MLNWLKSLFGGKKEEAEKPAVETGGEQPAAQEPQSTPEQTEHSQESQKEPKQ